MRRARVMILAALLAATACGGPPDPLEVGVREYPIDVRFGAEERAAPPPPPALSPDPGFPGFIQPPPPPDFDDDRKVDPCPKAHPFKAAPHIAGNRAEDPPVAATYGFRNEGRFRIDGPEFRSGSYPPRSSRAITSVVRAEDGSYLFDVQETHGDRVTTTTYRVVPTSAVPPVGSGPDPDAGLFILQVRTQHADGSAESFTPLPSLPLLRFPLAPGLVWEARGIDPVSGIVMSYRAEVAGKVRVDACGDVLDAWKVNVTKGEIVGPTKDLDFTASYAIATQFGALSVMDHVEMTGTDGDSTIDTRNSAVIMSQPIPPGAHG